MKVKIILIAVCIVLAGLLFKAGQMYMKEKKSRLRIENSFAAANLKIEYYKAENGKLVGKTEVLELKNSELAKLYPAIIDEIRNLKVKPGRVESYTENVITQEKRITTLLRDSVVNDTVRVKIFRYKDEYYEIYGCQVKTPDKGNDSITVKISSTDSIIQVVYRGERYKPWLWFLSRRRLEQVVSCKNPNAKVAYSRSILISNK